ncbi:hypothetical protein M433DRAFT_150909 [Acidomyces richmondensis BFW]|nr:MAG: hypothetical protein FE78DRAFT_84158 [Acidomyces sp. 'richmondensis']KYG48645.1 hypothetical protein M433DRAFT_150909 [Acidomyces richmondensis BFW]
MPPNAHDRVPRTPYKLPILVSFFPLILLAPNPTYIRRREIKRKDDKIFDMFCLRKSISLYYIL